MINKDTQLCMSLSADQAILAQHSITICIKNSGLILSIKPLLLRILKVQSKASVHLVFEDVPFRCLSKKAACHF